MNVLFLCPQLPFPGISGGTLNSKKLLDFFCSRHSVTLVSLIKNTDFDNIPNFCDTYNSKLKQSFFFNIDKPRSVSNYLCSIFKNMPLTIYRNYDKKIKKEIENITDVNSFDIIFCDYLIMTQYIPKAMLTKTIFNDNNAEYVIWKRFAKTVQTVIMKIIIRFEAFRIFCYETKQCNNIYITLAASDDIKYLQPYARMANFVTTYHLGNDDLLFERKIVYKKTYRLLFIGTMTWEANIHAIDWFVNNVYGYIKKICPEISLWIAGKYLNKPNYMQTDTSIHVLGFVDNLKPLYETSDIFICPLKYGSGTKIKLLDAMYRGLPIVTTPVGAESIDLIDGENCFIAENADDFAKKTITLLQDDTLWNKFSENSRILAKNKYCWESEYKRLETILKKYTGN